MMNSGGLYVLTILLRLDPDRKTSAFVTINSVPVNSVQWRNKMLDNLLKIRVRIHEKELKFRQLLSGRCFVTDLNDPNYVWIKLTSARAQWIDNEHHRVNMSSERPVYEAVLVVEKVCESPSTQEETSGPS
jgi:hypothetical protein